MPAMQSAILRPIMTSMLALMSAGQFGGDSLVFSANLLNYGLDSHVSFSRPSAATDIIDGVLTTFASGVPRISPQNGVYVETKSTNLDWNDVSNALNSTMTQNAADPTGGTKAWNVAGNGVATPHTGRWNGAVSVTAGDVCAISCFVKGGTCRWVQISTSSFFSTNIANIYANFDTQTGTFGNLGSGVSKTFVIPLDNGWYRIGFVCTLDTTATANGVLVFVGNGGADLRPPSTITTNQFFAYGPQFEKIGAVTSYIPTTTANATRSYESIQLQNVSNIVQNGEFSAVIEATTSPYGYDTSLSIAPRLLDINTSATDNYGLRYYPLNSYGDLQCNSNSVTQFLINTGSSSWGLGVTAVYGASWSKDGATVCLNGSNFGYDTTPNSIPKISQIKIGSRQNTANGGFLNGWIRKIDLYSTRLTNKALSEKTAVRAVPFVDYTMILDLNLMAATLPAALTLTRASSATDIVNGQVVTYANDAARINVTGGLLLEPPSTNILQNSNINAFQGTLFANSNVGPDGVANSAGLVVIDTGNNTHGISNSAAVLHTAAVYTVSGFVKAGTVSRVQLAVGSAISNTVYANFRLTGAGAVLASGSGALAANIVSLANGWYRVSITYTATANSGAPVTFFFIDSDTATRRPFFAGNGTDSFQYFGLQSELGANATSYIPTTTTSATRAAEFCVNTPTGIKDSAGTLYVEAVPLNQDGAIAGSERVLHLRNSGAPTSYHEIRRTVTFNAQPATNDTGVAQSAISLGAFNYGVVSKIAYAYALNDMAGSMNGGAAVADTAGTMPAGLNQLVIGANGSGGSAAFNGRVRRVRAFKVRKTNQFLTAMTA